MAEHRNDNDRPDDAGERRDDAADLGAAGLGPIAEEPMAVEAPRRAASAQFVVDADESDRTSLREAMDPANQSLAEALRLSYRVLQVVMLVLVVLFIFSGWKSVSSDQTGVLTVWGRIAEVGGSRALTPGLKFSRWPYPAGEFILFQEENLAVDLGNRFWPMLRPGQSFEEAVAQASVNDRIRPGRDGALLTSSIEMAHVQVNARYAVADPVQFVERIDVNRGDADRIVRLALQNAVVHTGAALAVEDITDRSELFASDVQRAAQDVLDGIASGLLLQAVNVPRSTAPLAIRQTVEALQEQSVAVEGLLERARQSANETLTNVAGPRHPELWRLVESYQEAAESDDDEVAEERLDAIGEMMVAERSGAVSSIINEARSYRSLVESTLGADARYFASILPGYREQPAYTVNRLWLETYGRILEREDAEIFYAPPGVGGVYLRLQGSERLANLRRDRSLQRQEQAANQSMLESMGLRGRTRRAQDIQLEGPGRQLDVVEEGGRTTVRPRSSGN